MKKEIKLGIAFTCSEFEVIDGRVFTKPKDVTDSVVKHLNKEYIIVTAVDYEGNKKDFRIFKWLEKRILVEDRKLYFIESIREFTLEDAFTGGNLREGMVGNMMAIELEHMIAQKETGASLGYSDIKDEELPMYKIILELHEKKHGISFK